MSSQETDDLSVTTDAGTDENINMSVTETWLDVAYTLIGITGILNNLFVVLVLTTYRSTRMRIYEVLIVNQSLLDMSAACILFLSTRLVSYSNRYLSGFADEVLCRVWLGKVLLWSFLMSSAYNVVTITLERYIAIIAPIWHNVSLSRKKLYGVLSVVWLIGPVFYSMYSIPTSRVQDGICQLLAFWPNNSIQVMAGLIGLIMQYFLPVTVLIFCYSHGAWRLSQRIRRRRKANLNTSLSVDGVSVIPSCSSNRLEVNVDTATKETTMSNLSNDVRHDQKERHAQQEGETNKKLHTQKNVGKPSKTSDLMTSVSKNMMKNCLFISLSFLICWSLNQFIFLFFNVSLLDYTLFSATYYHISVVMMFSNCCLNPFIYAFQYGDFKNAVRRHYRRIRKHMRVTPQS